jgi:hypothetical protein
MDLSQGWGLPQSVQERLRLLDWIADNGGATPGVFVSVGELFEGLEKEAAGRVAGTLDALEQYGLIKLQKTLAWSGYSCTVTPAGIDRIEGLRNLRGDLLGRRKAARDAVLKWLHMSTLRGIPSPYLKDFADSQYGTYFGHSFTEDEISAASEWLKAEGYITGPEVAELAGVLIPSITTRGEKVVESGWSVNDDSPFAANVPSHVTNVTVSGTGHNVATHSPGAVQTTTVVMSEGARKLVLPVADNLEGLLRSGLLGLDEQTSAEAAEVVTELRQAADEPEVEGGVLRRILGKAKAVAIAGTGSVMGQGVVALADQALQGLGLG